MSLKINKKSLLALPIAIVSLEIYLGVVVGYFAGKFFAGMWDGRQRIKSIFINIGNYRLHLHHWIIFSILGTLAAIYNLIPVFPQFFFGAMGGLVLQDLYLDEDWRHIVCKK